MHNQFKAISLSYKNAPIEIREKVSLDEASTKKLLDMIAECSEISEALVLSTCNRTEIYYASNTSKKELLVKLLSLVKGLGDSAEYLQYFIDLDTNEVAINHLYAVSIGLEAQVVGDLQIINQVKKAYQWSADQEMAGPFVHRLLHSIFYTNKRVVQETAFRDGAASVSYATVDLVQELTQALETPRILVVGLGEIGEDVARNLDNLSTKHVMLCNRSIERSEALAQELGYEVVKFEDVALAAIEADVIISSVNISEPLIVKKWFTDLHSHKYLFDLSVPRSIEEDIENINGLLLYNIDNITAKANAVLERRLAAIPDVNSIIADAIKEFGTWAQEMGVSPVINKLKNALEEIRQAEISRYVKKLTPKESDLVDTVTKSMMQKIIKLPVLQLKAACKRGEEESLVEVLNDLFNLEKTKSEEVKK
ncbi:glutamyl-tRNA reductase [Reichenbachiella versicolor]|uniref:glutamyl-tRNA reductase n=1 Tax=Reichenbachiella versicolor TaxID=1821036 RepID=UPI000D6DEDD2|nr:glutamyl-tRNA reductase [Reichenbachiella versicolor]